MVWCSREFMLVYSSNRAHCLMPNAFCLVSCSASLPQCLYKSHHDPSVCDMLPSCGHLCCLLPAKKRVLSHGWQLCFTCYETFRKLPKYSTHTGVTNAFLRAKTATGEGSSQHKPSPCTHEGLYVQTAPGLDCIISNQEVNVVITGSLLNIYDKTFAKKRAYVVDLMEIQELHVTASNVVSWHIT